MSEQTFLNVPEGRRFLLTCAMTTYEYAPDLNREELRENVARMVKLFCGSFGYEHVSLGESLIADELTLRLRNFSKDSDRQESDYVAVYLTGHGDLRSDREHVLLTRDSKPDDLHGKVVPTAEIGRLLLAESKIRRLLLMLDTCYSGQGGAELAVGALRWSTWRQANPGDGVVVVGASQPREPAKPEVFTEAFIRAAESKASAGDGVPATPVTAVINVLRQDPLVPESQHAVRLWDPVGGGPVGPPLTAHTSSVRAVATVSMIDGRTLLASGGRDGMVRLWDLDEHLTRRIPWWQRSANRGLAQPVTKRRMPGAIQDVHATAARCLTGAETALIVWDSFADDLITVQMEPDVEAVTAHLPSTIVVGTRSGIVVLDVPTTPAPQPAR